MAIQASSESARSAAQDPTFELRGDHHRLVLEPLVVPRQLRLDLLSRLIASSAAGFAGAILLGLERGLLPKHRVGRVHSAPRPTFARPRLDRCARRSCPPNRAPSSAHGRRRRAVVRCRRGSVDPRRARDRGRAPSLLAERRDRLHHRGQLLRLGERRATGRRHAVRLDLVLETKHRVSTDPARSDRRRPWSGAGLARSRSASQG